MFAIITGKYIIITGNIYRYYKECESHIKVMFVIFTRMYSQYYVMFNFLSVLYINGTPNSQNDPNIVL